MLSLIHIYNELTLTEAGKLLGCSRQNVTKLAEALERKGWVSVHPSAADSRASPVSYTHLKVSGLFLRMR